VREQERKRGREKERKERGGWEDTRHGLQRALYKTNACDETNMV